jgi:putative ABC transport system permease protein
MLIGEIIQVAIGAIRANKLRSFLTALGIVIGVGAVITMVSLGDGARKAVQEQIESLGTNLLTVYPGQGFRHRVAGADRAVITSDDAAALEADGRGFASIVPELRANRQVEYGNRNLNVSVTGTVPAYVPVNQYGMQVGQMFSVGDDESRRRVAMLGYAIPNMLSTTPEMLVGKSISIGGIPFEIVGVLAEKGAQGSWRNPDEMILIPLQTAQFRLLGSDRLGSITVEVANSDSMAVAMLEIERIMRREHAIPPGADNDFQILRRAQFLATLEDTTQTFTWLLASIAAVSLLVGGIGIMNIMLVSVTERTREIGVRKALGATRNNIMLQFLIEALVLCMLGGVLGILVGSGGAIALSRLANWNTLLSPDAIVIAFTFSALVGIFFGLWPARRAARLDPIEALRYE